MPKLSTTDRRQLVKRLVKQHPQNLIAQLLDVAPSVICRDLQALRRR